jgi:hypothetical protein
MRLLGDQPQGLVREPVAQGGTAHLRYFRQFPDTRATFEQSQIETRQCAQLCAVVVRVKSADGGQDGRGGGCADAGQLHQEWVGGARCEKVNDLVEPEVRLGQGIDQGAYQRGELELVDARGVLATAAGLGQVLEAVEGCRAPLPAALAGWPLFQETCAAVAEAGRWGGLGLQEAPSGRWRQVFQQRMECRKREVAGRAPWIAQWADAVLQGHGALPQAGGGLECSSTCHRQEARALLEQVKETVRICCSGFPGASRHGFAMVADGWAGHQTDPGARVFAPFLERLPIETGGLHGHQHAATLVFVQVMPEGVRKALAALPGVGKCQVAAADAWLRTYTSTVLGVAHIDANK